MKFLLLLASLPCFAQTLEDLERSCVPSADPVLVTAIVRTESSGNPWALSLNHPGRIATALGFNGRAFLKHQPPTKREAICWTRSLRAQGYTVSVGLMQVNVESSRLSVDRLLDPCTNLQVGWDIFVQKYRDAAEVAGPGQVALQMAISAYNTGSPVEGFRNGYVATVLAHAR